MISSQDLIIGWAIIVKMSKAIWACHSCGQDFMRKTSAVSHISNLHDEGIFLVLYTEYMAGMQHGHLLVLT
jgi:hypothetical protein